MEVAIGIDVGGTAIKAGLVSQTGDLMTKSGLDTEAEGGVNHVVSRIILLVREMQEAAQKYSLKIRAIGLGMPGTLSHSRGMVVAPPNLPGWRDVPIAAKLNEATQYDVILGNDANNAAFGEFTCGAGQGSKDMVLITLGTGVGGGIVLNGKLWMGSGENAGEIGHTIVELNGRECGCGQRGCLEAYASANATSKRATELIASGRKSRLTRIADEGKSIMAEDVMVASEAGDELAKEVWRETCRYLAIGCLNVHRLICGDRIVLAGGMSAAGENLRQPVVEEMEAIGSKMLGHLPEVRLAELGNDAGVIGSGLSVFDQL